MLLVIIRRNNPLELSFFWYGLISRQVLLGTLAGFSHSASIEVFLRCGGSLNVCDLVFIVVHDEEKSDVSISRLYLDDTGSRCLANTIVAYEILLHGARNLLSMERKAYLRRSGESRPPRLVHGCFREEILEAITELAERCIRI